MKIVGIVGSATTAIHSCSGRSTHIWIDIRQYSCSVIRIAHIVSIIKFHIAARYLCSCFQMDLQFGTWMKRVNIWETFSVIDSKIEKYLCDWIYLGFVSNIIIIKFELISKLIIISTYFVLRRPHNSFYIFIVNTMSIEKRTSLIVIYNEWNNKWKIERLILLHWHMTLSLHN